MRLFLEPIFKKGINYVERSLSENPTEFVSLPGGSVIEL